MHRGRAIAESNLIDRPRAPMWVNGCSNFRTLVATQTIRTFASARRSRTRPRVIWIYLTNNKFFFRPPGKRCAPAFRCIRVRRTPDNVHSARCHVHRAICQLVQKTPKGRERERESSLTHRGIVNRTSFLFRVEKNRERERNDPSSSARMLGECFRFTRVRISKRKVRSNL